MFQRFLRLSAVVTCFALCACGVTQPKYIDYTDEEDGGGTGTGTGTGGDSAECQAAQAEFDAQIQPTLVATCIPGCHALNAIAGAPLKATDSKLNRKQLKAYTGDTADKLFDQIDLKSQPPHGGGKQSSALPKDKISAWTTKEALCK